MEPRFYRSWHLAKSDAEFKIAEFEWSLIRFYESFTRFVLATGVVTITANVELKHQEHVILHVIRMQDRPKTSAMIGRLMNRDDIPNIQYSLRKLEAAGLIEKLQDTSSKTYLYCASDLGIRLTDEYYKVRKEILVQRLGEISDTEEKFERYARFMSLLTGIYDEAARDAATITPQTEKSVTATESAQSVTKQKEA
ncbi:MULTISPECIES: winged helix DNA-binding protein [unclassified Paraburkholderia]|uniref:winged helix DNA-binding protein n=1 Tax=unclassified Paraburkholderia TaxID=2615204 RepID=UPI0016212326|nr:MULTISPECIES: winged helix DNA-binding protein [unclassified Paraburkholderia]MBB5448056.1 putative MarR family transcription regulator [Paraburkholderia sp. WSM4177]MBB5488471.1 putative MarR family transcription regulator [Paraburkholderia sp. WSM4180]